MKSREEIITSMCYTYRHDYGLIVDNEEAMYTLTGITANQRQQIWNTMAQIFDNDIAPYMGADNGFMAKGWKPGDQASWNAEITKRNQLQSEYSRIK